VQSSYNTTIEIVGFYKIFKGYFNIPIYGYNGNVSINLLVHCWDYRRYLLDHSSSMSIKEELEFTTEKIQTNFSNYSSWHLRSTLLLRMENDFLSEELDLIKNAAFTDPNDQSVWFYHRWLIMSQLPKGDLVITYIPISIPTMSY